MKDSKKQSNKRRIKGVVISNKMAKTIVVNVAQMKMHTKYKKQYKVSKNYKVHDEKGLAKPGDYVLFEECRPLSKDKRWRLIEIIKK